MKRKMLVAALAVAMSAVWVTATVDDSHSFALEEAGKFIKKGFKVREDYWGGDLGVKEKQAIQHQLFKANEYWFWLASDLPQARLSVHIYDSDGNLAETESWQDGARAGARIIPKRTGTYYLIVEVSKSPEERTSWALVYAYR